MPKLPNFLYDDKGTQYSVGEFSRDELEEIGREWTAALIKKSKVPI